MKKRILPFCLLVLMGCSKKDNTDDHSTSGTNLSVFSKNALRGTWSFDSSKNYMISNDSLMETVVHPKGSITANFRSDDTLMLDATGDPTPYGKYSVAKLGNKNILIFSGGPFNDSNEVISYSATSLVISNKMKSVFLRDKTYWIDYLSR